MKKRSLILPVLLTVFFMFAAGNAYAVFHGYIYGTVSDIYGSPVIPAEISTAYCSPFSNLSDGSFLSPHVAGNFTLNVRASGYYPYARNIVVNELGATRIDVVLRPLPPTYVHIGNSYAGGRNNTVEFFGLNNGQCTRGYATCRGNWWVNPCNWQSSCSTAWEYNPSDYYSVSSSYCNCN